jgi:hypothetical protein
VRPSGLGAEAGEASGEAAGKASGEAAGEASGEASGEATGEGSGEGQFSGADSWVQQVPSNGWQPLLGAQCVAVVPHRPLLPQHAPDLQQKP